MIATSLRGPLTVQLLWTVGAAAWNVVGVQRIAAGQQALGPTASYSGAIVIVLVAIALIIGARSQRWLYVAASLVVVAAGGFAVWGAIVGQPEQWPSIGWRIGGAVLNAAGAAASLMGIFKSNNSIAT